MQSPHQASIVAECLERNAYHISVGAKPLSAAVLLLFPFHFPSFHKYDVKEGDIQIGKRRECSLCWLFVPFFSKTFAL